MNPERWQKLESIFQAAVDLKIEDRKEFLKSECNKDSALKSEVENLLNNLNSVDGFLEGAVWTDEYFAESSAKRRISESIADWTEKADGDFLIGTRIGVFEIKEEIGRGGMGTVYLAERADGEFKQKVAIKLVNRGMNTDFIVNRFRNERQILASFEHPHIARLLDGGTTPDGLPYFVMEFVEGETLYDYCDKHRLDITKRLELFTRVCEAISYAHEKQIIHRDIKPGNILVTKNGMPKLLDFGIAKILNTDLIHESQSPTASIIRLLTPDYASPEQIQGLEITPASDIYSLGVLLYELLTGHRPYDFCDHSLDAIAKVICETEPKPPNEILGSEEYIRPEYRGDPSKIAETRNTSLARLCQDVGGDLEKIVLKALSKEPNARYRSADDFSEDIYRYANGKKVASKYYPVQQNGDKKGRVSHSAGTSIAVLPFKRINVGMNGETEDDFLGLGLADALITRLSRVRDLIVRPTSSIQSFTEVKFDSLLAGKELQVDHILDGSIKRAGDRLRVTVQLLDIAKNASIWATTIDETVGDIFALEDAISRRVVEALMPQLTRSEFAVFSKRGTNNAEAYEHYLRGRYHFNTSTEDGFAKAFLCFNKAIAEDPNYSNAYVGLADYHCFLGIYGVLPPHECFATAIEMAHKAVELDSESAEAHATLGFAIHGGNYDWSKAEYHLGRSLELNPNSAIAFGWLAIVRYTEGFFADGLEFARKSIELDPLTPFNHHNLGWGLYFAGRFDESIAQYQNIISNFPDYGLAYYGISKSFRMLNRTKEAFEAIEKAKHIFGETNFIRLSEAETFAASGKSARARKILRDLTSAADKRFVSPYQTALVYCNLGDRKSAFECLETSVEIRDPWLNWFGTEPVFDLLRDDERVQRILESTGYDVFFGSSSVPKRKLIQKSENSDLHDLPTLETQDEPVSNKETLEPLKFLSETNPKRRLVIIAAVILVLVFAAGILLLEFNPIENQKSAGSVPRAPSIVILPLKTRDSANEDRGIGFSIALSNRLGYIKRLSVIAPSSAPGARDKSSGEIGKKYDVGYVLSGTIDNQADRVAITAELTDPATETVIWTEAFVAEDGNLSEIQSEIAEKIWTTIGIEPMPTEIKQVSRVYTDKPAVYDLYLRGQYYLAKRSPENIRIAIKTFQKAVEIDSNFALGYAGLADAYVLHKTYELPSPVGAFDNQRRMR
ncbi:MAG: protein kinase [Pyrinomonadaceae bacterium]|nr:protein kinase [Pyrinomonadaceae bacterium]